MFEGLKGMYAFTQKALQQAVNKKVILKNGLNSRAAFASEAFVAGDRGADRAKGEKQGKYATFNDESF